MEYIPFDGEPRDTRLLSQDVATNLLNHRLAWRLRRQLLVHILIVYVVSHTHKLPPIVAASEQDDRDTNDLAVRDAARVGRVGLEDELVDAGRDWPNKEAVELLIVLGPKDTLANVHGKRKKQREALTIIRFEQPGKW